MAGPLSAALQTEQDPLRKMAALVLGDLAPRGEEAIPALIDALRDEDEGLRRRAVVALGQFGAKAHAAVDSLARPWPTPTKGCAVSRRPPCADRTTRGGLICLAATPPRSAPRTPRRGYTVSTREQ